MWVSLWHLGDIHVGMSQLGRHFLYISETMLKFSWNDFEGVQFHISPLEVDPGSLEQLWGSPAAKTPPTFPTQPQSRCPCLGLSGPSPPYLINTTNPGVVSACQRRWPPDWPLSCSQWPGHEAWLWVTLCQQGLLELRGMFELQLSLFLIIDIM